MLIEFSCAACGKELAVAEALAGQQIQCPACQAEATVPAGAQEQGYDLAPAASPRPFRPSRDRPVSQVAAHTTKPDRDPKPPPRLSRGMMTGLVVLACSLILGSCCLGCGGVGWLYFFNFTGSELVGQWETDRDRQPYGQLKFSRFGHATFIVPSRIATSVTGNWRVASKEGETYTILVWDSKTTLTIQVTVLGPDRVLLSMGTARVELRRM